MPSRFVTGDFLVVRLGGMDGEDLIDRGFIEEVISGNPPDATSQHLPEEPNCYRLEGRHQFYRESCVIEGYSYLTHDASYHEEEICVPEPLAA